MKELEDSSKPQLPDLSSVDTSSNTVTQGIRVRVEGLGKHPGLLSIIIFDPGRLQHS